jgi:bifunctional non-homologous end joining protein LigD
VIARKNGTRVRLYSRPGNDLTRRFPRITEAVARLKARTCIIDGEAVACGPDGIARFDLLRDWARDERVFLRAFDLIELNGDDLRHTPIELRKAALAKMLSRAAPRIQFNEHIEEDGGLVFDHACNAGLRGYRLEAQGLAV